MVRHDSTLEHRVGPLRGYKIIEMAGIGPAPFCGMMLADMGAQVVRIDRTGDAELGVHRDPKTNLLNRNKRSVAIDLKNPKGVAAALRLIAAADVVVEGFRPGVMERLGLGPDICLKLNPRLVFGRVTGWGQDGPNRAAAGHDINYIAVSGVLSSIGRPDQLPVPPMNLIGDFAGGGMYLAFGVACALLEAAQSGRGQVIDAAMVDGAASLMTYVFGLRASGRWVDGRGRNATDGGAPFYDVYETSDAKYVAVGAIESRFFREFLRESGMDPALADRQWEKEDWPVLRSAIAKNIRTRSRDEWCRILESGDTCFSPVLSLSEALDHSHIRARATFIDQDGITQPAPAPRLSRTPGTIRSAPPVPGENTREVLTDWGFGIDEIAVLFEKEVIAERYAV